MADRLSPEQRHLNMSHVHSASTKPELALRHALWKLGYRYRINDKRLPGTPDIVLPKYRTVIFVHGCFWHAHKDCPNYTTPKTNTEFWTAKIARNQQRDQDTWRQLEARGWNVIIVWECELRKSRLQETVEATTSAIRKNGEILRSAQDDRKKASALYQEERRQTKERKRWLTEELHRKYPH